MSNATIPPSMNILRLLMVVLALGMSLVFVFELDTLIEIGNVIVLALLITVFIRDLPTAWKAVTTWSPTAADLYIGGTWSLLAGAIVNRFISILYRSFDMQRAIDSPAVLLFLFLIAFGAVGQLNSVHVVSGNVPRKQWTRVGLIAGAAAAIFAATMQFKLWF